MILIVSVVVIVFVLVLLLLAKGEKLPEKEKLLQHIQQDITLLSQSNPEELKKLSTNLQAIYDLIEAKEDYSEFLSLYSGVNTVKMYLKNLNHYSQNDKRIVKDNMCDLARKLNDQIRVHAF